MYNIKIISQAQKDLDGFYGKVFQELKERIVKLSSDPRPYVVQKLTGEEGYRIRYRDYRIIYRVDDKAKEVIIYRIKHRKEVYR